MSDTGGDDDLRVDSVEKEDSTPCRRICEMSRWLVVFVKYVKKGEENGEEQEELA